MVPERHALAAHGIPDSTIQFADGLVQRDVLRDAGVNADSLIHATESRLRTGSQDRTRIVWLRTARDPFPEPDGLVSGPLSTTCGGLTIQGRAIRTQVQKCGAGERR